MRIVDADRLKRSFEANTPIAFQDCVPGIHAIIDLEPTVDAIVCDNNFGFAGYINENDEYGIRVKEVWNKDLTDEELLAVMCGVIQDILADERLKRLWENATEMAEFLGGYDG